MKIGFYYLISLLYYLAQMINVYTAIEFYKLGSLTYLVCYLIIIAIDKIFTYITSKKYISDSVCLQVFLLDLFNLGFLNSYETYSQKVDHTFFIPVKVLANLYPIVILQTFIHYDVYDNGFTTFLVLCYINYLVQLCLISLYYIRFLSKTKNVILSYLTHFSFNLTLRYMVISKDLFGFNLGYYCIAISLINVIFIHIIQPKSNLKYKLSCAMFLLCNTQNYYTLLNKSRVKDKSADIFSFFTKFLSFFNQFCKLILIVTNLMLMKSWSLLKCSNVYQLNLIIALSTSILFLIVMALKIQKSLLYRKKLFIITKKDYINATKFLNVLHPQLKNIKIYIYFSDELFCNKKSDDDRPLINECLDYNFQKNLSYQLKSKQKVIVVKNDRSHILPCKFQNLYREEEFISVDFKNYLTEDDKKQIIFERLQNGFIFTEATNQLIESVDDYFEKYLLQEMKQNFLQQVAFIKIINPLMGSKSQQIYFNLYEEILGKGFFRIKYYEN